MPQERGGSGSPDRHPLARFPNTTARTGFSPSPSPRGDYGVLENQLLSLLTAGLPDDPMIRISDYARHGLLINDIHVILCPKPVEARLFKGEVSADLVDHIHLDNPLL